MRKMGRDINFWIGVTDLETEGKFCYVSDGRPVFDGFHPFWIDRDKGTGHCVSHTTGIPDWLFKVSHNSTWAQMSTSSTVLCTSVGNCKTFRITSWPRTTRCRRHGQTPTAS